MREISTRVSVPREKGKGRESKASERRGERKPSNGVSGSCTRNQHDEERVRGSGRETKSQSETERERAVLTMFRVERRPGAEITDQGVSKQLRCRQEVRPNSVRLEVTARRSRGLRPAAGCGRGSRLTGSALSPLANGRVGYIGD